MKRMFIMLLLFAGFMSSVTAAEVPADTLPGLTSPNGLRLNLVNGFESWRLVSAHVRIDRNELHYIWGNDEAMRAVKTAGTGKPAFRKGAILVKMGYRMTRNPLFPDSVEPAGLQRIEYMIKDPARFPDTGGWGYARFPYDAATGAFSVYGTAPDFAAECHTCHLRAEKSDFVFTRHMNYFAGANPDAVTLSAGASLLAKVPRWMWHPLANAAAFIVLLCGIIIARYMKRKWWWTAAHISLQIAGIALLAAGISAMVMAIGQGTHFNVPHAYLGLVTAAGLLLTGMGGIAALTLPSLTKTIRPIHRWAGRISVVLMFLTILSGILISMAGR